MRPLLLAALLLQPGLAPASAAPPFQKVLIVVLENADLPDALAQPFLGSLAARGALLADFHAETHPSQPNYIALVAGGTYGLDTDADVTLDVPHVGDLLEAAGRTWKVYAEGYPGGCFLGTGSGRYVRRHVPFLSFRNVQTTPARCARIVDASVLATDIRDGTLPDYALYVPDLDDDGHDTGVAYADGWLARTFGPLLDDPRLPDGMLVVVTFDEGTTTGPNRIYTALVGPGVAPGSVSSTRYDHTSLLRTIEEAFGLGSLGQQDAAAAAIAGVWQPVAELTASGDTVRPGDRLVVDVAVTNDGPARLVDVYFGALLPPEAGPAFGCAAGEDAVALAADGFARVVVTCRSVSVAAFVPLVRSAALPASLPRTALPGFWSVEWPPGLPVGAYTLFLALTPPGAFADGRVDAGDLIAVATRRVTVAP